MLKSTRASPGHSDEADDFDWRNRSEYWQSYKSTARGRPKKFKFREPLILCGHAAHIRVDRGSLLIRDGFTHYPQKQNQIRLFPGDGNLPDRIVMLDGSGGISFDALTWMTGQNIIFVQLDWRGYVNFVGGYSGYVADRKLVELQLALRNSKRAIIINRHLISTKFEACIGTIKSVFPKSENAEIAISKLKNWNSQLKNPRISNSISRILGFEGSAALAYYKPWQGTPLKWSGLSRRPIPDSWHEIGPRSMAWRRRGNNARHPINAMLNYGYGVLISQIRAEVVAAGLDPTIGIVHSNPENQFPLVYDLMEPLRPLVDRKVLEFAISHTFAPSDFAINRFGGCRINPQMAKVIAGQITDISSKGTISEFIKQMRKG